MYLSLEKEEGGLGAVKQQSGLCMELAAVSRGNCHSQTAHQGGFSPGCHIGLSQPEQEFP